MSKHQTASPVTDELSLKERQLLLLIDKKDDFSQALFKKLANKKTLQRLIDKNLICETGSCDSCKTLTDEIFENKKHPEKSKKSDTTQKHQKTKKVKKTAKPAVPKVALSPDDFKMNNTSTVVMNIMLLSIEGSKHKKTKKLTQKIKQAKTLSDLLEIFPKWKKVLQEGVDSPDIDTWISQVENHLIPLK